MKYLVVKNSQCVSIIIYVTHYLDFLGFVNVLNGNFMFIFTLFNFQEVFLRSLLSITLRENFTVMEFCVVHYSNIILWCTMSLKEEFGVVC